MGNKEIESVSAQYIRESIAKEMQPFYKMFGSMTQRDEAYQVADRLDSSDPQFDDCTDGAALLRSMAAEIERLQDYDTRLTAVMPEDFKDWHQNSKAEWPEIAAGVITNQREHIDFYIEDLDRKDAEIERLNGHIRHIGNDALRS